MVGSLLIEQEILRSLALAQNDTLK